MRFKVFLFALIASLAMGCNNQHQTHEHEHEGHEHEGLEHEHEHVSSSTTKKHFTVYSTDFELFAVTDPFIVGHHTEVLAHITCLPSFKALESGSVTLKLTVGGKEMTQTLDSPTRKGIYIFDIHPETAGKGQMVFEVNAGGTVSQLTITDLEVFAHHDEAHKAATEHEHEAVNTATFSKAQSWKIDFATGFPSYGPFGQVIKTTALVQSAQNDEIIVQAKTNGVVSLTGQNVFEGNAVSAGQFLFTVTGSGFADNNLSVRYAEAKSNYEKAKLDYERASELAVDKIVSEKDLLATRNQFENAKAVFDNLNKNFGPTGQRVSSPMSGFVKQLFVSNGTYVEAGQPVMIVAKNKSLVLRADVQQKYATLLGSITSANIRTLHDGQTYTLEQMNGKLLSYGKAANADSYLLPINFQVDNLPGLVAGSFVDIYIKTTTNAQAMTIDNGAIMEDQGHYFVYVQLTPELFEKREVIIGATDGIATEIRKGLRHDERVVLRGAVMIKLSQASGTLDAHSGHVH